MLPDFIENTFYFEDDSSEVIDKGEEIEQSLENFPILGKRYDDRTLYAEYSSAQDDFEKVGSLTIRVVSQLFQEQYSLIDLLIYVGYKRYLLDQYSVSWRGLKAIETGMSSGNREVERKKFCEKVEPNEILPGEYKETPLGIIFLSDYPKYLKSKTLTELQDQFKLVKISDPDNFLIPYINEKEDVVELGTLVCSFAPEYIDEGPYADYFLFLEKIYEEIVESSDMQESIEGVALLHYYLCLKTPFSRGGGAVAEWICAGILISKNVPFLGWTVEVWNKAVTRGVTQFKEEYSSYILVSD